MKEAKPEQGKSAASGCFDKMHEMMREMMSNKGGPYCSFAEKMAEKMQGCCAGFGQKESPAQKADLNAPR